MIIGRRLAVVIILYLILCASGAQAAQIYTAEHDANGARVIFNAQVDRQKKSDAQALRVRIMEWPEAQLESIFFEGRDVDLKADGGVVEYINEQDASLTVYDGMISYRAKELDSEYRFAMYRAAHENWNRRGEIAGYALEEAYAQVKVLCEKLGVKAGEIVAYTAMDAANRADALALREERLREHEALLASVGEFLAPWTAPSSADWQEGYYLSVVFDYDGLSCLRQPTWLNSFNRHVFGSGAYFFVTKQDGVLYMESHEPSACYEIMEVGAAESRASISMEQAVKAVVETYGQVILQKPVEIGRIAYEYVPIPIKKTQKEYKLQPAWCFYPINAEEAYAVDADFLAPVFINAFNGKEIK
ncbi:MAG: hypothetical protein RR150_09705 [Clostridia bacterium]